MSTEEEFEQIGELVSQRAAKVACPKEAYIDGLRGIIERLQTDIEAAKEC